MLNMCLILISFQIIKLRFSQSLRQQQTSRRLVQQLWSVCIMQSLFVLMNTKAMNPFHNPSFPQKETRNKFFEI